MGVKLDPSLSGRIFGSKKQEVKWGGENNIIKNFMIYTLHHTVLGRLNKEE
jgi:hypothetical protein